MAMAKKMTDGGDYCDYCDYVLSSSTTMMRKKRSLPFLLRLRFSSSLSLLLWALAIATATIIICISTVEATHKRRRAKTSWNHFRHTSGGTNKQRVTTNATTKSPLSTKASKSQTQVPLKKLAEKTVVDQTNPLGGDVAKDRQASNTTRAVKRPVAVESTSSTLPLKLRHRDTTSGGSNKQQVTTNATTESPLSTKASKRQTQVPSKKFAEETVVDQTISPAGDKSGWEGRVHASTIKQRARKNGAKKQHLSFRNVKKINKFLDNDLAKDMPAGSKEAEEIRQIVGREGIKLHSGDAKTFKRALILNVLNKQPQLGKRYLAGELSDEALQHAIKNISESEVINIAKSISESPETPLNLRKLTKRKRQGRGDFNNRRETKVAKPQYEE